MMNVLWMKWSNVKVWLSDVGWCQAFSRLQTRFHRFFTVTSVCPLFVLHVSYRQNFTSHNHLPIYHVTLYRHNTSPLSSFAIRNSLDIVFNKYLYVILFAVHWYGPFTNLSNGPKLMLHCSQFPQWHTFHCIPTINNLLIRVRDATSY